MTKTSAAACRAHKHLLLPFIPSRVKSRIFEEDDSGRQGEAVYVRQNLSCTQDAAHPKTGSV